MKMKVEHLFLFLGVVAFLTPTYGQIRSDFYADWIPKNIYTQTELMKTGNSEEFILNHDLKSFGVSYWIKNFSNTSASTNFYTLNLQLANTSTYETIITASINRPSGILLSFSKDGYSMNCEAYFGDGFQYDDWVYIFFGISFPRWEAYGYARDNNNIFGQTKNGSCYFSDPDNPYVPNNTFIPKFSKMISTIDPSYEYNRLIFHPDYFPMSFFGLMTDFNPYGTKLINRYILPTFIKNKFIDVSTQKKHITFYQPDNYDGLIISNNYISIPEIQQNIGLSFTISFWLKIIPQSFSERFKIFSLLNKNQQVLYSLTVMDLKTMGDSEINADYLPRLIPLRKWMHVTIHSYNSSNNNAWIHTTMYFENSTQKFPNRHYEKVRYYDTFTSLDDFSIVIGENSLNGTDENYYFMIDDFTILQGGTISTHISEEKIAKDGNCVTRVGFLEQNTLVTPKSDYICVLCNENFYSLKGECVSASDCKIRDTEKRICKDIDLDAIDSSLSLTVTYVKLLRNGHQIKITLPPSIKYDENSRFGYTIPGLENKFYADEHPQESNEKNSFYVNVTFSVNVDNNFPLLVTYYDQDAQLLNGTIVLPPIKILSEQFLDTVTKISDSVTKTVMAVAGGSLIALTMIGNLAPVFSLIDMLQIISLMIYINAPYPLHVEIFFDKLINSQLNWLPNFTNDIITNILSSLTSVEVQVIDQESDGRFNLKGLSTSFILNGGSVLSLQLSFVIVSIVVSSLRKLMARKYRSVSVLLKKLEDIFDINYFLRSFQAIDIPLTLGLALQIYNISGATPFNIISACFAMIGLIYVLILTFSIYNISLNLKKAEKEKEVRRLANKFSAVFEALCLKNDFGIFNSLINYLKKYLIIYLLVYYQAVPVFQSMSLLLLFMTNFGMLVKNKAYEERAPQGIAIFTELLIYLAHFIPAIYILELTTSTEVIYILGWILIGLILANIFMNFMFVLYLQWVNRDEIKRQFKKLYIRIRNIFRKKPASTLRIKRSSVFSAYRLKRMDRLNQEDIKKFGFKNDKGSFDLSKNDTLSRSISIDDNMNTSSIEINLNDSTSIPINKKEKRIRRDGTKKLNLNVKTRNSGDKMKSLEKNFELNEIKDSTKDIKDRESEHSHNFDYIDDSFVNKTRKNLGEDNKSNISDSQFSRETIVLPARTKYLGNRKEKPDSKTNSQIILPSLD